MDGRTDQPTNGPTNRLLELLRAAKNYTLDITDYTLHIINNTLHTKHFTINTTHYTLHTTQLTLHTINYTLQTTHYTLNTTGMENVKISLAHNCVSTCVLADSLGEHFPIDTRAGQLGLGHVELQLFQS